MSDPLDPTQVDCDPTQVEGGGEDVPAFEWPVYLQATLAGLSILIPIPLVDMLFERLFRNRMPRSIAAHRRHTMDKATVRMLNDQSWSLAGCLFFPVWLLLMFLKRLYRTVLYFLTIKDATDKLSLYWHRAYLIDLALRREHFDEPFHRHVAVAIIRELLDELTTSPLTRVAQGVVGRVHHVLRAILRMRRNVEDEAVRTARERLGGSWSDMGAYLAGVGAEYDARFARSVQAAIEAHAKANPT